MKLKNYLVGGGIDVSQKRVLAKETPHTFINPDNLYSLKGFCDYESQDFIYSKGLINKTKFFRILIKEWINFCKVNGYIIIEMSPNKLLNFEELVDECKLLLGEKGVIVEKGFNAKKNQGFIILKKTRRLLLSGDTIDKWTFGIITGGFTDPLVDKSINSILTLKIPHFEIIICGVYNGKYKKVSNKYIKFIHFDSSLPWITKKKNLICEKAKYENLVIIHDRISFKKNWYSGMKRYGNYFEILSCVTYDPLKRRAQDWMTYGIPTRPFSKYPFTGAGGNLEYNDWDKSVNIAGLCIMKKSIWEKCPWDERLLLWQAEDLKISGDFYYSGFVPRFNTYSEAETAGKQYGDYQLTYKFNKMKRGKPTSNSIKILIAYYFKNFLYNVFKVYLKRSDVSNEMQRTFAVPIKSKR